MSELLQIGAVNVPKPVKVKKARKLFSAQEDAILTNIMYHEPFQTWIHVAEKLPGRTARQCRDRWVNYLSPSNKNGPWSQEEDQLLAEKYLQHGPQWTSIAKYFDGRSENNVKNRWYTYVKTRFNAGQLHSTPQTNQITQQSIPQIQQLQQPHVSIQNPQVYTPKVIHPSQIKPLKPLKNAMTPSPGQFMQIQIQQPTIQPIEKKPLLPPISVFDDGVPRIPAFQPGLPRFKSESVQPFALVTDLLN